MSSDLPPSAAVCLDLLRSTGGTLATAESLTAGMICATLAGVAGASDVLRGGVAAYATDVKTSLLGVDPQLVARHGVISAECAEAMAVRARALLGATWALSATGVAGPTRQEDKPVGMVFVAAAGPDIIVVRELALSGSRDEVRVGSVTAALDLLAITLTQSGHTRPRGSQ